MRRRILAPLAVLVLVLASAASAAAATGVFESNDSGFDSPRDLAERGTAVTAVPGATSTSTSLPETTLPQTTLPQTTLPDDNTSVVATPGTTQTLAAGDAGSVTVQSDGNTLTVLAVNANAGFSSEVEQGTGSEVEVQFNGPTRVDFNAELEDGAVRVRVRVGGVVANGAPTTPTTTPEGTSGPGNAHEDEDDRGPGNPHDSTDDDNSGSGHSGSGHSGSDDSGSDD